MTNSLGRAEARMSEQRAMMDHIIAFLGVFVPDWKTLRQVQEGDDVGATAVPSAAEVTLDTEIVWLRESTRRKLPHEAVVRLDPPAGTLVARGSTVRVTVASKK